MATWSLLVVIVACRPRLEESGALGRAPQIGRTATAVVAVVLGSLGTAE
jgi:hypothetical protein